MPTVQKQYVPPAYVWHAREVAFLAVIVILVSMTLMFVTIADQGNFILGVSGGLAALWTWPVVWQRAVRWNEIRKFRKEIDRHED